MCLSIIGQCMMYQILTWCIFMHSTVLVQCVLLKVCRTGFHYLFAWSTPPFAQLFFLFIISTCPFKGERELKWPPASTSWLFWEDCPLEMCRQCAHLPFTAQKVSLQMVLVEGEPTVTQHRRMSPLSHTHPPHERGRIPTLPVWYCAKIVSCVA